MPINCSYYLNNNNNQNTKKDPEESSQLRDHRGRKERGSLHGKSQMSAFVVPKQRKENKFIKAFYNEYEYLRGGCFVFPLTKQNGNICGKLLGLVGFILYIYFFIY